MEWSEIDNNILLIEKACNESLAIIENMELFSQVTLEVDDENTNISQQINILKQENATLKTKLDEDTARYESSKKSLESLLNDVAENEKKAIDMRGSIEMKPSDNLRMMKARETLNIGKKFTGIRWDFAAPNNLAKGYIANKHKNILEPFEFDKNVLSEEAIQQKLWQLIEAKSTQVDWSDLIKLCTAREIITNKENIQRN